jgi:hypothetical protein
MRWRHRGRCSTTTRRGSCTGPHEASPKEGRTRPGTVGGRPSARLQGAAPCSRGCRPCFRPSTVCSAIPDLGRARFELGDYEEVSQESRTRPAWGGERRPPPLSVAGEGSVQLTEGRETFESIVPVRRHLAASRLPDWPPARQTRHPEAAAAVLSGRLAQEREKAASSRSASRGAVMSAGRLKEAAGPGCFEVSPDCPLEGG